MPYNVPSRKQINAIFDEPVSPPEPPCTTPQVEVQCVACGRRVWCAVDALGRDSDGLPHPDDVQDVQRTCGTCGASTQRTGRFKWPDASLLPKASKQGHGTSEQVYKVHLPELTVRW